MECSAPAIFIVLHTSLIVTRWMLPMVTHRLSLSYSVVGRTFNMQLSKIASFYSSLVLSVAAECDFRPDSYNVVDTRRFHTCGRFHSLHDCVGQTDGQTDRQTVSLYTRCRHSVGRRPLMIWETQPLWHGYLLIIIDETTLSCCDVYTS